MNQPEDGEVLSSGDEDRPRPSVETTKAATGAGVVVAGSRPTSRRASTSTTPAPPRLAPVVKQASRSRWLDDDDDDDDDDGDAAAVDSRTKRTRLEMVPERGSTTVSGGGDSVRDDAGSLHETTTSSPYHTSEVGSVHHRSVHEPTFGGVSPAFTGQQPVIVEAPEEKYYPGISGSRMIGNHYKKLGRISEGTFGVVYRARCTTSGEIVALKKLKLEAETNGFPITSIREVNMLLKGNHPHTVNVREIVVGGTMDEIYIAMEYLEHDMKELLETIKENLLQSEVKTLMVQLLAGLAHLHDNWILHRDLKTANLLLSNSGILKIADFGSAREYGSPIKNYTPVVCTLWYRSPELLYGAKTYSTELDVWSIGAVFAEFIRRKPLFQGNGEISQLDKIFDVLGTPNNSSQSPCTQWPGLIDLKPAQNLRFAERTENKIQQMFRDELGSGGMELMLALLTLDPKRRISVHDARKHKYFSESPAACEPAMFPTWPERGQRVQARETVVDTPPANAQSGLGKAFNIQQHGSELGY